MTWLKWVPSSKSQLIQAEQKLFAYPSKPVDVFDVDIGCVGDVKECKIHTIKLEADNASNKGSPLVLIHGFGCGVGIFVSNYDALSKNRDVYAIDMVGFGLSSRPMLSRDAMTAEKQMVQTIEEWRQKMKLDKFILLGHSLGGFVSSSYALTHSEHVKHLILEDPWGFPEYDPNLRSKFPLWAKTIMSSLNYFNAMATIRAAGPYGPNLMKRVVGERHYYFRNYFPEAPDTIPEYLYHCSVRRPTGEEFFRNLCVRFGWTKYPMGSRLGKLNQNIGITFIHGERTFISKTPSKKIQSERSEGNVEVHTVKGAGHTIHMECPEEFNRIVNETCDRIDI